MNIEQMRARLSEISGELEGLYDEAGDTLTPEQEQRFEELSGEADEVRQGIVKAEERSAKLDEIRTAAAVKGNVTGGSDSQSDPLGRSDDLRTSPLDNLWDMDAVRTGSVADARSRALSAVERAAGIDDATREHVTRFLDSLEDDTDGAGRVARHIVTVSSPDYMRNWSRYAKSALRGQKDVDAEQFLSRAASLTDAAGGFAVPLPVDPTLVITSDGSTNPFRQISDSKMITGDSLRVVSSTHVSFSWDGEAAEVSDDATTFANVDIPVHKAQGFVPFSIEIGQDYPNFTSDIRTLLANGRDDLEAAAFVNGTGSDQPTGIVTALSGTASEIDTAAVATFAVGDVYALDDDLPAKHRRRASWVAHRATYNDIRQFDTQGGADLWERLAGDVPSQLIGRNAYEAEDMDNGATTGNELLVYGDFSNYCIVDRVGFSVELVPHLFATANNRPSGQRGFYAYWRVGADSVNDGAFRMLQVG